MYVETLIEDAYRLGKVIPETGDAPDSTQIQTGIRLLNDIIRGQNISGRSIALISTDTFELTPGDPILEIPGYIGLYVIYYLMGSLRFTVLNLDLQTYFSSALITNANGIPVQSFCRRTSTGIELNLYFAPNQNYSLTVWGIKMLSEMAEGDQIAVEDEIYATYFKWQLAQDLRAYNQLPKDDYVTGRAIFYSEALRDIRPKNQMVDKSNIGIGQSYGDISELNILRGYSP